MYLNRWSTVNGGTPKEAPETHGMARCLVSVKAIPPLSTSPTAAWGLKLTSEVVNCQVLLSLTNWPDLGWRDTFASCSSLLAQVTSPLSCYIAIFASLFERCQFWEKLLIPKCALSTGRYILAVTRLQHPVHLLGFGVLPTACSYVCKYFLLHWSCFGNWEQEVQHWTPAPSSSNSAQRWLRSKRLLEPAVTQDECLGFIQRTPILLSEHKAEVVFSHPSSTSCDATLVTRLIARLSQLWKAMLHF